MHFSITLVECLVTAHLILVDIQQGPGGGVKEFGDGLAVPLQLGLVFLHAGLAEVFFEQSGQVLLGVGRTVVSVLAVSIQDAPDGILGRGVDLGYRRDYPGILIFLVGFIGVIPSL